jgi:biopolymer transport protein ExbB/TolQ
MSSFKHFQREVHFLKNIYWFLFFIAVCLFVFFKIVSVDLNKYKKINKEVKQEEIKQNKAHDIYIELKDSYSKQTQSHKRILESTSRLYSEIELSYLLSKFFSSFDIEKINTEKRPTYMLYNVRVTATTTSPNNIYLFIKDLKVANGLLELTYPIEFESKNGYLDVIFMLKVYTFK